LQELKELNITMNALVKEERFNEFFNLFDPIARIALQNDEYCYLIDLYLNRSKVLYNLGDIQSCIADLKKLTEWMDEHGTDGQKTKYLNTYATVCGELGDQRKYLEYLTKAKELAIKINDVYTLCKIYNNLGVYYLDEKQPENAVNILLKPLEFWDQIDNEYEEEILVFVRLNLSKGYTELGEYQKAEELFDLLFAYIEGKQMTKTAIYVLQYKGLWFKAQRRYEEAKEILLNAKDYASINNDVILLEQINKILVEVITEIGDKDSLIAIQKDYIDSLLKIKEINLSQSLLQIEMSHNEKQYESISNKDPLTSCYNRDYFEKTTKKWLRKAKDTSQLMGFFIFDVDSFKQVNDHYGHLVGDDVLKHISNLAVDCLSKYDSIFARYGGDEFVAIVKISTYEELTEITDNIYKRISKSVITFDEGTIPIRVSIGVSTNANGMITEYREIFKLADDALYESKRNGRNQYTMKC